MSDTKKSLQPFIMLDDLTGLPVVHGDHDCSTFGCHYHAEDYGDDVLYDGAEVVGCR